MFSDRSLFRSGLAVILLSSPSFAQSAFPLTTIQVEGSSRFPVPAIVAASGLHQGQRVTKVDFDNASKTLYDTGLFAAANYRYAPSPDGKGFFLTLQVEEARVSLPVRLEIPGLREDDLWAELAKSAPLVTKQIPSNAQADAYYKKAIESALIRLNQPQPVTTRTEADLKTGKSASVFLPVNLPKVKAIDFAGNHAFDSSALVKVLAPIAVGRGLTEHDVIVLLDANIKPLYENKGYLTVKYSGINFSIDQDHTASVSTVIDEGPVWTLGRVELAGDIANPDQVKTSAKFPEGKLANWQQIQDSFLLVNQLLARNGYLGPRTQIARTYHDDSKLVDLLATVQIGKQSFFGSLILHGLDPAMQLRAEQLWKLKPGAPMDAPYVNDYLHEVLNSLRPPTKSVSSGMKAGTAPNTVDIEITFK